MAWNSPFSEKLIHVGYTNGYQIYYAAGGCDGGEGLFYSNTDNDCHIPLYMMASHAHRLETTSGGHVTLDKLKEVKEKHSAD